MARYLDDRSFKVSGWTDVDIDQDCRSTVSAQVLEIWINVAKFVIRYVTISAHSVTEQNTRVVFLNALSG